MKYLVRFHKMILFLILTLCVVLGVAFTVYSSNQQPLALRLDAVNDANVLPRNFRIIQDLHISGSAEFSKESFTMLKKIIPSNEIIVIDLREESHGFINGNAVSWYGNRNWANLDKNLVEVQADETQKLANITLKTPISINKDVKSTNKEDNNLNIIPNRVLSEEQLVKELGTNYYRITVTDHRRPLDSNVDQFIQFVRDLPTDTWLHFHCKAGQGRTTTFMVMYDMMHNAKTTSMEDIITRQHDTGGIDLFAVDKGWKKKYSEERIEFIEKFYQYCKTNDDGFKTTWSDWAASYKDRQ